jgi:hypothetical protein
MLPLGAVVSDDAVASNAVVSDAVAWTSLLLRTPCGRDSSLS